MRGENVPPDALRLVAVLQDVLAERQALLTQQGAREVSPALAALDQRAAQVLEQLTLLFPPAGAPPGPLEDEA